MCYTAILRSFPATIVAVEKQRIITYTECVFVALGTQQAMRLRHIVICGLSCYKTFFHISHKRNDKKVFEYIYIYIYIYFF